MNYKIITTGYNCFQYLENCFESIKSQEYQNFEVILIDDCSTDKRQPDLIEKTAKENGWYYILNNKNYGNLYNQIKAIHKLCNNPDDIIVFLDADDRFARNDTFNILDKYYSAGVDMTYGSYETDPPNIKGCCMAKPYPKGIVEGNRYRGAPVCFNHLRTLKYNLILNMDDSDFKDLEGNWFKAGGDFAIMFPALELCGGNYAFVKETLLIYTADNPIAEWKTHTKEVKRISDIIVNHQLRKESLDATH